MPRPMEPVVAVTRLGTVELIVIGLLIWLFMAAFWARRNRGG